MPYKGNRRKKRYTHKRGPDGESVPPGGEAALANIPKSIVLHTDGAIDPSMSRLVADWRKCFLPYTMVKLGIKSRNKLKDYVALSSSLGLTHMHMFSSPDFGATLRVAKLPNGPTVQMRVESYATMRDIVSLMKRPFSGGTTQYMLPPMVVLNGFTSPKVRDDPHVVLLRELLQSLVPAVSVDSSVKLSAMQRVLFFQYIVEGEGAGLIEVRHYYITARPVGINRAIQKLKDGRIPRTIGTSDSFSDVLTHEGLLSDTDGEGEEVQLPSDVEFRKQRGNCRVKLVELGPRMTWRPLRMEAGLFEGEVLWHQHICKTPEELLALHERAKRKERIKRQRAKEQQENIERKKQAKEATAEKEPLDTVNAGEEKSFDPQDDTDGEATDATASSKKKKVRFS